MITFTMAIGLPGCGKSTYGKHLAHCANVTIISTDDIRESVFNNVNDQTHNNEVFQIAEKKIIEALKNGEDVYFDATNISRKKRKAMLNNLKTATKSQSIRWQAILFPVPTEVCIERQSKRERKVPSEVIYRMMKNFNVPAYFEGWDEIITLPSVESSFDIEQYLIEITNLSHDNPHHKLSVGNHMIMADKKMFDLLGRPSVITRSDYILLAAARYHDIGKPLCKKIDERTGIAHYYNHQNIGAYMILCYLNNYKGHELPRNDIRKIALIVEYHMIFFNSNYENLFKKLPAELVDAIKKVHLVDLAAH